MQGIQEREDGYLLRIAEIASEICCISSSLKWKDSDTINLQFIYEITNQQTDHLITTLNDGEKRIRLSALTC